MDDFILNFEHIFKIFDANVIALHWGLAGSTFGVEKLKLKLPSVEQTQRMKKTPNLSIGCVHQFESLSSI
jgi:hypothetical protein